MDQQGQAHSLQLRLLDAMPQSMVVVPALTDLIALGVLVSHWAGHL